MVTNFGCTVLLIVLILAFPLEAEQSCQNSTKRKEPHCVDILSIGNDTFQIFADISLQGEWQEAQTYCESVYKEFEIVGRLAVLSNNSVFEEVRGYLMNDSIYTSADCVRGYWIGCMNNKTNNFTWIDKTHLATNDSVWFPGQPDLAQCALQESSNCKNACCQMWIEKEHDSNLKIDDASCTQKNKFFICQFPNGTQFDYFRNCSKVERQPHKPKLCPADTTSDDKGIIHWPDTGVKTTPEMKCPYSKDSASTAKRKCVCKPTSSRAEWESPVTSACTSQSQASRGERLNHLANTTIPPGQAKKVAEQLANITSEADNFEENDVTLSVDVIDNILESGANGTEIEVAEDVLMSVDNLLHVDHGVLVASQQNENTATRLIESVEKLALIVQFVHGCMESGNLSVTIETENIALILAEMDSESFAGLKFRFSSGNLELSRRTNFDDVIEDTKASVHLPTSLLDGLEPDERTQVNRVQFVVHKLNTFFKAVDIDGTQAYFSPVIAASIGEFKITNLKDPVRIQIPRNNQVVGSTLYNVSCAFWDYSLRDGAGAWSEEGCEVSSNGTDGQRADSNVTVCECNHLTNFALLVNIYNNDIDETQQKALSIISYIGCGVSLIALIVTLISIIVYRKKKNKAAKILISLCSALSMALLMFLIGGLFVDLGPRIPGICATIAVLQHYLLLAVLLWMALEATYLYLKLVKVFEKYIKNFMVKYSLIGWGVPLIIVIIVLAVDVKNYGFMYNDRICWLSQYAFYGAFLVPFGVVLIFNSVIFCLVIHQICGLNSRALTASERFSIQAQLRAAIGLMALLGLTWTFAIFAISEASLVFMYLFAIFNSLQGLFIFVFHCALKTDIQNGWKRTFCGQEKAPCESKESNKTSSNGIFSTAHKYQVKDTDSKTVLTSDSTTTT